MVWSPQLRASPRPIRELRELTRHRTTHQERIREVQRLDKLPQDAGIKLSSVAIDIIGVSGRAMLEALVAVASRPGVLAALAKSRVRTKRTALAARFRTDHHGLMVAQILAHIDLLDEAIAVAHFPLVVIASPGPGRGLPGAGRRPVAATPLRRIPSVRAGPPTRAAGP